MATQTQTTNSEQNQPPQGQAIVRGSQGQATPSRRGGYALGLPLTPIDFFRMNPFSLMRRMSEELDRAFGEANGRDQGDLDRLHGLGGFPRRTAGFHGKAQAELQGPVNFVGWVERPRPL